MTPSVSKKKIFLLPSLKISMEEKLNYTPETSLGHFLADFDDPLGFQKNYSDLAYLTK